MEAIIAEDDESVDVERVWNDPKEGVSKAAVTEIGCKRQTHRDWFDDNDLQIYDILLEASRLCIRQAKPGKAGKLSTS